MKKWMLSLGVWSMLIMPVWGETCYVLVESTGSYEAKTVEFLSLSLIRQFVEWVEMVPPSGVGPNECVYRVAVVEDREGLEVVLSGQRSSSFGDSKLRGKEGLKQGLLNAIYRSGTASREKLCEAYADLVNECSQSNQAAPVTPPVVVAPAAKATTAPPNSEPEEVAPEESPPVHKRTAQEEPSTPFLPPPPRPVKDLMLKVFVGPLSSQDFTLVMDQDSSSQYALDTGGFTLGARWFPGLSIPVSATFLWYRGDINSLTFSEDSEEDSEAEPVVTYPSGFSSRSIVSVEYNWFFANWFENWFLQRFSLFAGMGFHSVAVEIGDTDPETINSRGIGFVFGTDYTFDNNMFAMFIVGIGGDNSIGGTVVDQIRDAGGNPTVSTTVTSLSIGYSF
ncbi:MAG: hypothetical protein HQM12_20730 [SAR324 cluster bacterium]|nr:hypothetical protein [SAR324 cluster bacterium]